MLAIHVPRYGLLKIFHLKTIRIETTSIKKINNHSGSESKFSYKAKFFELLDERYVMN
jgi:hypothetical protein